MTKDKRDAAKVYFVPVSDRDNEAFIAEKARAVTEKSGILLPIAEDDFVGIKLHFGEAGNTGFIRPAAVKEIVGLCARSSSHVALIETNTIYAGERSNSIAHLKLAQSHGFGLDKVGAPIIIADGMAGRDLVSVNIGMKHIKNAKIASGVIDCDYLLGLAHVTGHCQTGLAGSIKNIGMGCASRAGKLEQHSTVFPEIMRARCTGCGLCIRFCPADAISITDKKAAIDNKRCIGCGECTVACRAGAIEIKWNESTANLQEKMAEYAAAALMNPAPAGRGWMKRKCGFVNFLIKMTKDCDCMAKDDPRIAPDIGILASSDPVAIDKATTDILIKEASCDRLKEGYPEIDWRIQLEYAQKIGLGSLAYELIAI